MSRRATTSPAPPASTATTTATTPKSTKTRCPSPKRRASASPARDVAGVKNITRKVIRTLEGLGHQQLLEDEDEDEDEEGEVAHAVVQGDNRNINTVMDKGKARAVEDVARKVDWEIPRKASPYTKHLPTRRDARAVVRAGERVHERVLGFLMRESEKHSTNGTLWYILGVNFALTFYPIDVATVAVLMALSLPFWAPSLCALPRTRFPLTNTSPRRLVIGRAPCQRARGGGRAGGYVCRLASRTQAGDTAPFVCVSVGKEEAGCGTAFFLTFFLR
ncbi:hypothetical protein C8J57DRAFT_1569994 [Mycena rebaudengoi]|nr:hypothetical protein C8J57DRAFT_1569994 [Mycena rebaudengoi]